MDPRHFPPTGGGRAVPLQELTVRDIDIRAAQKLLRGVVRTTPVVTSRALSDAVGGPVLLKCENLQRTGSFKIRGAYTRLARLSADERARGVVAASAGNHAQGVALAASLLDVDATVFMPTAASIPKVDATRGYGARVRLAGETVEAALRAAHEHAERTGAVLVHPFDHADVVAGQGTVGLEVLDQVPDVATVLVATGGGGLLGGIGAALAAHRPAVRIVGVQAANVAPWPASLAVGEPVVFDRPRTTIADGIAVGRPGDLTFRQVAATVDEIVTVDEGSLSRALLFCLERAKMLVEPAGAAPVAALLDHPDRFTPPVVAVLSGGNVDPLVLLHVIQSGMASADRYLSLRIRVEDRPGTLAELLALVGRSGANVVDIGHTRTDAAAPVGEVDVSLDLETRGPEHCHELYALLRDAGHPTSVVGGPVLSAHRPEPNPELERCRGG